MRRIVPLFLWISLCGLAWSGYSLDLAIPIASPGKSLPVPSLQSLIISGKVSDESGIGMPGVNVIVKGTSNGTNTNVGRQLFTEPQQISKIGLRKVNLLTSAIRCQTFIKLSLCGEV